MTRRRTPKIDYRCLGEVAHTFKYPPAWALPNSALRPLCPRCHHVSLPAGDASAHEAAIMRHRSFTDALVRAFQEVDAA